MVDLLCDELQTIAANSLPNLTHFALLENKTPWKGNAKSFSNLIRRLAPNVIDVVPGMCECEGIDVCPSIVEVPNWCFSCHSSRELKCWEIFTMCEICCNALCGKCPGGILFECVRCGKKGELFMI